MADTAEAIVYGESVRAIDKQEAALQGLHGRTGTLLATASLSTAFLGGQALARQQGFTGAVWFAVGAFVAACVLAVVISWPWTWSFSMSALVLIEDHVAESTAPEHLHLFLAGRNDANWRANQLKLVRLQWAFRGAAICLVLEVLSWLVVLGRS